MGDVSDGRLQTILVAGLGILVEVTQKVCMKCEESQDEALVNTIDILVVT